MDEAEARAGALAARAAMVEKRIVKVGFGGAVRCETGKERRACGKGDRRRERKLYG